MNQLFDGPCSANVQQTEAEEERSRREADFIVRELELTPEHRVLDLACGLGLERQVAAYLPPA